MKTVFMLAMVMMSSAMAQDSIMVESKIFEVPKGVVVTKEVVDTAEFFENKKIAVMSSPRVTVESGKMAIISVGGTDAETGISVGQMVQICPTLNGAKIDVATRAVCLKVEHMEQVTVPFEFNGSCANGGTVLLTYQNQKTGRTECVYMKVTKTP